jgi:hypothetical protein
MENQQQLSELTHLFKPSHHHDSQLMDASERRPMGGERASASGQGAQGPKGLSNVHISPSSLNINNPLNIHEKINAKPITDKARSRGQKLRPRKVKEIYKSEQQKLYEEALVTAEFYPDGGLIDHKEPRGKRRERKVRKEIAPGVWIEIEFPHPKRGKIKQFSRQSRKRQLKELQKVDVRNIKLPLFITLTYPDEFPDNKRVKRDLKVFLQRLQRKFPECSGLWRFELKERRSGKNKGKIAPHYHFFLWGVGFVDALRWVDQNWYEVCNTGDPNHLLAGTSVESIKHKQGVMYYAGKYMAKLNEDEIDGDLGRIWGKFGEIPQSECVRIIITRKEMWSYLRWCRRKVESWRRRVDRRTRAFFVSDPMQWIRSLLGLVGDEYMDLPDCVVPF